MKYLHNLFIIGLLFYSFAYTQTVPAYVSTNGLVGWWPFNGNANDESGNDNHRLGEWKKSITTLLTIKNQKG